MNEGAMLFHIVLLSSYTWPLAPRLIFVLCVPLSDWTLCISDQCGPDFLCMLRVSSTALLHSRNDPLWIVQSAEYKLLTQFSHYALWIWIETHFSVINFQWVGTRKASLEIQSLWHMEAHKTRSLILACGLFVIWNQHTMNMQTQMYQYNPNIYTEVKIQVCHSIFQSPLMGVAVFLVLQAPSKWDFFESLLSLNGLWVHALLMYCGIFQPNVFSAIITALPASLSSPDGSSSGQHVCDDKAASHLLQALRAHKSRPCVCLCASACVFLLQGYWGACYGSHDHRLGGVYPAEETAGNRPVIWVFTQELLCTAMSKSPETLPHQPRRPPWRSLSAMT